VRLEFTAAAELEFDEAVAHYNLQHAGLGADFAVEARHAAERVVAYPYAWQALDDEVGAASSTDFPTVSYTRLRATSFSCSRSCTCAESPATGVIA
jgi:hypothetical protein